MKPRKGNSYLEGLKRRQEATRGGEPDPAEKPVSEMGEAELEAAITDARRELLELQRSELSRAREEAREISENARAGGAPSGGSSFARLLRDKKRKRPGWR